MTKDRRTWVMIGTDAECFRINTQSTYNVIEAAVKLGIPKVIFASSETTWIGVSGVQRRK